MNDDNHSDNDSDDETLREEFLEQFDDESQRHRTEQAFVTIGQTHLTERDAEHWGGTL